MLYHLGKHRLFWASPLLQPCPLVPVAELEPGGEGRTERLLLPTPGHHMGREDTGSFLCSKVYSANWGGSLKLSENIFHTEFDLLNVN